MTPIFCASGPNVCMHRSMPILAQRLAHRTPTLAEGFCGLERGLYATDLAAPRAAALARRSPPHHVASARPASPGRRVMDHGLPVPPPPTATGHAQGVPEPILEDPRGVIPVYATYRIIEDPRV